MFFFKCIIFGNIRLKIENELRLLELKYGRMKIILFVILFVVVLSDKFYKGII